MEHSDETGLPSSNPSSNSSQPEETVEPQQEPPKLAYKTLSYHQMKTAAEREAREYMASWPMNDRAAKNIPLHGSITGLFRDISEPLSFNALVVMRKSIDYRMNQVMGAATVYKDFWGIDVPDCHQVNVDAGGWSAEAFRWACRYALLDEPGSLQGHPYVKGSMYMAYCITEAGWDQAEAEAKLDTLLQYKEAGVFRSGMSNIEGTSRIRAMIPKIMSSYEDLIREELEKIAQYMKLRVQMVSSTQSLQEEVPAEVPEEESPAWPFSGAIQERGCGSLFITALADTLLRLTMEGYNTGEVEDHDKSQTYAGLIKVIRDSVHEVDLRKTNVDAGLIHQPMFISDHDEWEMEYGERTGLAMIEPRPEAPGGEHQFGLEEKVLYHDQLKLAVKKEARRYLDSEPGIDSAANNIGLHGAISRLLKDTSNPDIEDLVEMRESIGYRMNQIMGMATRYKNEWGLDIRDCHLVDVNSYMNKGPQNQANMFSLVCKYPLFDEPTYLQGRPYVKGKKYITRCILEAGWNPDEAADKLDRLVKYKNEQDLAALSSGVAEVESTNSVMATLRRIFAVSKRSIREELEKISERTNLRIRLESFSMSPQKRVSEESVEGQ